MGRQHQRMDKNRVSRFTENSGRQGMVERHCCNVNFGAPTTVRVKGLRLNEFGIPPHTKYGGGAVNCFQVVHDSVILSFRHSVMPTLILI